MNGIFAHSSAAVDDDIAQVQQLRRRRRTRGPAAKDLGHDLASIAVPLWAGPLQWKLATPPELDTNVNVPEDRSVCR